MKAPGENFIQAYIDYLYLIEKSYPLKTVLKMVVTRFSLSAAERSMLYRGVAPSTESRERAKKKVRLKDIGLNGPLHIDALNVIITIHAYLTGLQVYISTDGFLRDVSEMHGENQMPHLHRSIQLLFSFLEDNLVNDPVFYLDEKADVSVTVNNMLQKELEGSSFSGKIVMEDSIDRMIETASKGIAATSDSTIIKRSVIPVADLPEEVLQQNFEPDFLDLQEIS